MKKVLFLALIALGVIVPNLALGQISVQRVGNVYVATHPGEYSLTLSKNQDSVFAGFKAVAVLKRIDQSIPQEIRDKSILHPGTPIKIPSRFFGVERSSVYNYFSRNLFLTKNREDIYSIFNSQEGTVSKFIDTGPVETAWETIIVLGVEILLAVFAFFFSFWGPYLFEGYKGGKLVKILLILGIILLGVAIRLIHVLSLDRPEDGWIAFYILASAIAGVVLVIIEDPNLVKAVLFLLGLLALPITMGTVYSSWLPYLMLPVAFLLTYFICRGVKATLIPRRRAVTSAT
jgi:hypothetical protein